VALPDLRAALLQLPLRLVAPQVPRQPVPRLHRVARVQPLVVRPVELQELGPRVPPGRLVVQAVVLVRELAQVPELLVQVPALPSTAARPTAKALNSM